MILGAGLNLYLPDLVCDFEGHRWGVVWAPLQPDVGQCRPQAARRTKTTPPPERGWYPARSSCSVRCNTNPRVSTITSRMHIGDVPSVSHQTAKMGVFEISGQVQNPGDVTHLDQISENHVSMRFEDRERDEQQELTRVVISPEDLPEPQYLIKWELALERDQDPSEAEEQVQCFGFLCNHGLELVCARADHSNSPKCRYSSGSITEISC
jgi:hypothetical protein